MATRGYRSSARPAEDLTQPGPGPAPGGRACDYWAGSGVNPPSSIDVFDRPGIGNPVVGTILGPRSEILLVVHARPVEPVGFARGSSAGSAR
jgi:hypothetical protein